MDFFILTDVYKVNIKNVGLLSSLPIWFAVIAHPLAGTLADYLRTNIFSVQKVSCTFHNRLENYGPSFLIHVFETSYMKILWLYFFENAIHTIIHHLSLHVILLSFKVHKIFFFVGELVSGLVLLIVAYTENFYISMSCFCLLRVAFSLADISYW